MILWAFLLFGASAFAKQPVTFYSALRESFKTPVCRDRFDRLRSLQEILSKIPYLPAPLKLESSSWFQSLSSERLLEWSLSLEQGVLVHCKDSRTVSEFVAELKGLYLSRFQIESGRFTPEDKERLFRGFILRESDIPTLKRDLTKIKSKKPTAQQLLGTAFGSAKSVRGVEVVGNTEEGEKTLESVLGEICPMTEPCRFWDSRVLYKGVVTTEPGIAAYIPEVATLVVSVSLLEKPNLLKKIILLHELTHVATRSVLLYEGKDWDEEFRLFSGWYKNKEGEWRAKVRKALTPREDGLTKLSQGSAFSILPDTVYVGVYDGYDGFVLGKGYEQSLQVGPEEDLADHVAIYKYYPERFCYQGDRIAPKKFEWISKWVFDFKPKLSCETRGMKEERVQR